MIQRFPIAGLARDKRPAFWAGDFYEQRDGGQHASYDTFVVKAPQATSERFKGAAIVATVDGHVPLRVSRTNTMGSGFSERGGNFVWLSNDQNPEELHYFAHLRDMPLVSPGQPVKAGQLIGYLGDSGNARGRPHLHFSVRRPSGAVDVYDQLRAVEPTAYQPPIVIGAFGVPWQRWAKVGIGVSLAAGAALLAYYFLWPRKQQANPRKRRARRRNAELFDAFDLFGVEDVPAVASVFEAFSNLKRDDEFKVGRTRFRVFKDAGTYTKYVYKEGTPEYEGRSGRSWFTAEVVDPATGFVAVFRATDASGGHGPTPIAGPAKIEVVRKKESS